MSKTIRVSLHRSMIGRPQRHRNILKTMKLTKINRVIEFKDSFAIRGMIKKVSHLILVEEDV